MKKYARAVCLMPALQIAAMGGAAEHPDNTSAVNWPIAVKQI
jgi:hypothetical protein